MLGKHSGLMFLLILDVVWHLVPVQKEASQHLSLAWRSPRIAG